MGFTTKFGDSPIAPATPSYEALTISANTSLVWPIESMGGVPYVAQAIDLTATAGGLALLMPDATQGATGVVSLIANVGANTFALQDSTGTLIVNIAASQQWLIVLSDNGTAAGEWRAYQLAATTSSANAGALAGLGLQAVGSQLQTTILSRTANANGNIVAADRAKEVIWTGANGTLTYDTLVNLTTGWWGIVTNQGTGNLTIEGSGGATINGVASLELPAGNAGTGQFYTALVVCTAGGLVAFTMPIPVPISAGGTGATNAGDALTNLGGTAVGVSIFTAPNVAAVLAILGISAYLTESTVAGVVNVTTGSGGTAYQCSSSSTLNLPLSTTVTRSFFFYVNAFGGTVVIQPQGADAFGGGTGGTPYTLAQGSSALVITDANGNWWGLISGTPTSGAIPWAIAGGGADTIAASYTPPNPALSDGMLLAFRAAAANATTTPTFAPDGLTAHTITKDGGVALVPGDIPHANAECLVRYNLANTRWELLNPATNEPPWAAGAGSADAITATYSPANPALIDGLLLGFRATAANATTTPTFAPDGLTAHTITKGGGNALVAGDIPGQFAECLVRYNLAHTRWELLNPAFSSSSGVAGGIAGSFRKLKASYAGGTQTGTITADAISVGTAGDASVISIEALNVTLDISSNGAVNKLDTGTATMNTLYYLWAISNGITGGVLASLSATAPTMPAGYTYKTRIGAFFTDGAAHTIAGTQFGRAFYYALPANIANGTAGTYDSSAPTWAAVSTAGTVPATASKAYVQIQNWYNNLNVARVIAAPSNAFAGIKSTTAPPPLFTGLGAASATREGIESGEFTYASGNIYWASDDTGGALWIRGWEDNL